MGEYAMKARKLLYDKKLRRFKRATPDTILQRQRIHEVWTGVQQRKVHDRSLHGKTVMNILL